MGRLLGRTTFKEFREDVRKWFEIGSARPGQKMSAARMLHLLESKYPMRYDLPTEKQINALITKLSVEEKQERISAAASMVDDTAGRAEGSGREQDVGNGSNCEARNTDGAERSERGASMEGGDGEEARTSGAEARGVAEGGYVHLEGGGNEVGGHDGSVQPTTGKRKRSERARPDGDAEQVAAKKKRSSYQMPKKYADFLTYAVVNDRTFKRCEARDRLIVAIGFFWKGTSRRFTI